MRVANARILAALLIACGPLGACERGDFDELGLEERLRDDPTRRAHRGTLLALHAAHQAHDVARAIAARPHPACAREATSVTATLTIRRLLGSHTEMSWRETRDLRVGDAAVELRQDARWTAPEGDGALRQAIRVIGERTYVRDDLSEAWYERVAARGERERLIAHGSLVQVLLDAVPGWTEQTPGRWVGRSGEARLRCDALSPIDATWLLRFGSRGRFDTASFEHSHEGGIREVRARWTLEGGRALEVELRETWRTDAPTIAMPERIEGVERERAWSRARKVLDAMVNEGIVTAPLQPLEPTETQ